MVALYNLLNSWRFTIFCLQGIYQIKNVNHPNILKKLFYFFNFNMLWSNTSLKINFSSIVIGVTMIYFFSIKVVHGELQCDKDKYSWFNLGKSRHQFTGIIALGQINIIVVWSRHSRNWQDWRWFCNWTARTGFSMFILVITIFLSHWFGALIVSRSFQAHEPDQFP